MYTEQIPSAKMSDLERKIVAQKHTIIALLKANRRLKLRVAGLERTTRATPTVDAEDVAYALRMAAAKSGAIAP